MSPRKKRGRDGEPPAHPLARAIEQIYESGGTPRLVIDARRADVVVPDHVRAKWAEKLVIDLDAAYPLDLVYDPDGVHASLAFSGVIARCMFAWSSIYRVIDRRDGRGIVVPAHEPPTELPPELAHPRGETRTLTEVVDAKRPALAAAPTPSQGATTGASSSTSDAEAKARRAKFRVIEGG